MKPSLLVLSVVLLVSTASISEAALRKPVRAGGGMVVSADSMATAAGVDILKRGGNAIDAAVAVGFCLAVTFPEAGNLGGGGFMVIRRKGGESTMIDFREKAPSAATRDMFLDPAGNPIPDKSTFGPMAAGVPGSVAGLLFALRSYGTMERAEILRRAIELADGGIRVDRRLETSLKENLHEIASFPSSAKMFTRMGQPYRENDLLRQPDLAHTLKLIGEKGEEGFYRGEIASLIDAEMKRSGGIMTAADLEAYAAVERTPVKGTYRGFDIISSAPPSAGGTVLLEMLNILERFNLREKGQNSSQTIHLIAAAAQRAYADRATYLGDPDFFSVPEGSLISKQYAAKLSRAIDSTRAIPSISVSQGSLENGEGHHTTHYCVADRFGNAVSVTTTLNGLYGCKLVVDGAGFFLNNEMDDFVVKPGVPNMFGLIGGDANAIQPGKRMLSSMTPTIIVKNEKPFMILGARGGSRIPTTVAQIIVNVIDFGMNIQQAVDAPRIHYQWFPDKLYCERLGFARDVTDNLQRMGYTVDSTVESNAEAEAIMIDPGNGEFFGAPDPREEGVAIGF